MLVTAPCPRCPEGLVRAHASAWTTPAGPRHTLWLDEPARCSAGCPVAGPALERVLLELYDGVAWLRDLAVGVVCEPADPARARPVVRQLRLFDLAVEAAG